MTLDLPCQDKPTLFTGDGSYECSTAPSTVDQVDVNLVSDFDGPLNFVLGAFWWESDGHNKFYTHTASYNVLRSFDLHPLSQYFGPGNDLEQYYKVKVMVEHLFIINLVLGCKWIH